LLIGGDELINFNTCERYTADFTFIFITNKHIEHIDSGFNKRLYTLYMNTVIKNPSIDIVKDILKYKYEFKQFILQH
jgi:hypothetical protein